MHKHITVVCWSWLTPTKESLVGIFLPNSGFRDIRWVAWNWSWEIFIPQKSANATKQRFFFPPERPLSNVSAHQCKLQCKLSLCHRSLNISALNRATNSCDLVTNSWNLRTGGDLKGHQIIVTSFFFFIVSSNTVSPRPVCLDISNRLSFSILYHFINIVYSHLFIV